MTKLLPVLEPSPLLTGVSHQVICAEVEASADTNEIVFDLELADLKGDPLPGNLRRMALTLPAAVEATPQSLSAMTWEAIPMEDGGFNEEWPTTADAPQPGPPNKRSYIRGEFYGPHAEEVGGVFERAGIIGAFGAGR